MLNPDRPTILTIGKYDGVHIGHQHLLAQMRRRAADIDAQTAVILLHPNPLAVLRPETPVVYLCSLDERQRLIADQGIDQVIVYPFTREVAQTSADDFMANILAQMKLVELWEGPAFALGRGRQGTIAYLRELGRQRGFSVQEVPPFGLLGQTVSTSLIRQLVNAGAVDQAAWLLGRPHALAGEVIHGAKRGRQLGFPTANLDIAADLAVPANGIYAVRCQLGDERLKGVASIGTRPTFDNGPRSVEVYILDFDRDIYGQVLRAEFVARLRDEQKFPSVQALIGQMGRDVATGRAILHEAETPDLARV